MTDEFTVPRRISGSGDARELSAVSRIRAWWDGHEDVEKTLRVALALLAVGFALVWLPLALIVPGAILALVAVVQAVRAGGAA